MDNQTDGRQNKASEIAPFPKSTLLIACEWVAKLDRGELSTGESRQLTAWLKQDPGNRAALAAQLQEWSDMSVLQELTHLGLEQEHHSWSDALRGFCLSWRKPYLGGALSIGVLAISVAYFAEFKWAEISPYGNTQTAVELAINTSIGEQKREALPDGSVVHVNTRSAAEISYTREQRSVVLQEGEAFFDVASEEGRPFVVYAGDTSVRAIGTAFAVHRENGIVSVSVTEGTVEFVSAGITNIVSAEQDSLADGNYAVYADQKTSVEIRPAEVLARHLAWQDGMLEFRGEPLEYVINELSRYTDAQIVIIDDEIKDVRLGGYFKIGDIEGLTSTLELGFNIQVDVVSSELIHVSRGEGY